MPFTFSHPAIVLPFKNKYLNFSGLILGSMAPDFIYFVLFSPSSNIGHEFLGFFFFYLPMCFLINYVFYKYIQKVLILSMPNFILNKYIYLTKLKNTLPSKKEKLKFAISCLIGMITHVFWDSFTHISGFFVNNMDFLRGSINVFNMSISIYKIIQHSSTIVGFLVIFIYLYTIKDKNTFYPKMNKSKLYLSLVLVFIIAMIISIFIFVKIGVFIGIGRLVVTFINSLFISYLITGFLLDKNII